MKISQITEGQILYDVKQTESGPVIKEYEVKSLMKPIGIFVNDNGSLKKLYITEIEDLLSEEEAQKQFKVLQDYYIEHKDDPKFLEKYNPKDES